MLFDPLNSPVQGGQNSQSKNNTNLSEVIDEDFLNQPPAQQRVMLNAATGDKNLLYLSDPDTLQYVANAINRMSQQQTSSSARTQVGKSARKTDQANNINTEKPSIQSAAWERSLRQGRLSNLFDNMHDDRHMLTDNSSRSPILFPNRTVFGSTVPLPLSSEMGRFAKAVVPGATGEDLNKYLPDIVDALRREGYSMDNPQVLNYVTATIGAETGNFTPLSESSNLSNTTAGGTPFDKYDGILGNKNPGDGERYKGRGFVQLTGRDNYRKYGKAIGLGTALEEDPEMANDPQIAARVLAEYVKEHMADRTIYAKGQPNDHGTIMPGLQAILSGDPDPKVALDLYKNHLEDINDDHPEYTTELKNHDLVKARVAVNGASKNTGLPNGLAQFLPGYAFGHQYQNMMRAEESNPSLTVAEAAKLWTEIDPFGEGASYMKNLQRQIGLPQGSKLEETKLSALTPQQRQGLEGAQIRYAQRIESRFEHLAKVKARVEAARKNAAGNVPTPPANQPRQ